MTTDHLPELRELELRETRDSRSVKAEDVVVTLNRSAIIVKPKQPFLDWLQEVDPTSRKLTLRELAQEPTIYLIPECDTDEEVADILRGLCEEIFIEQLAGWFKDATTWPEVRSFDVFCHWFEFQHHSMLVDLCEEPLIGESDRSY